MSKQHEFPPYMPPHAAELSFSLNHEMIAQKALILPEGTNETSILRYRDNYPKYAQETNLHVGRFTFSVAGEEFTVRHERTSLMEHIRIWRLGLNRGQLE